MPMTTRSKISWVVIGVTVGIALTVFTHLITLPTNNWLFWLESVLLSGAILSLILRGSAEIFKIVWLAKAERTESAPSKRPVARSRAPQRRQPARFSHASNLASRQK